MFLNQYASILNGPPRLAGFRLAGFAGNLEGFQESLDRFYKITDLSNQTYSLNSQIELLNKQAIAETDATKKARIRQQQREVTQQDDDILLQINALNNESILEDTTISEADKANLIQTAKDKLDALFAAQKASENYLTVADTYQLLPDEQKQAGSVAEAVYVEAANTAINSVYTYQVASIPNDTANQKLYDNVDTLIKQAADLKVITLQNAIDSHPVVIEQLAVTEPVAIATANVTSTTTTPVFSEPTIGPLIAIPAPPGIYEPIIERTKPSFTPLIAIAGLAFLLGKI